MKDTPHDNGARLTDASVAALILAGGASSRMGQNKALLRIGGLSLIERVLGAVRALTDDILLITNHPAPYAFLGLPTVADLQPNYGPLMGLYSGLSRASRELVLLIACDMPFVNTELLQHMLTVADDYDIVIPDLSDGLHPLHAVYRRSTCLPAIADALAAGEHRMISFHGRVRVRRLGEAEIMPWDADGVALMNVNTPEELAAAEHIARRVYFDREEA